MPGHTLGHIALVFATTASPLSATRCSPMGCGRLFEGTPGADVRLAHRGSPTCRPTRISIPRTNIRCPTRASPPPAARRCGHRARLAEVEPRCARPAIDGTDHDRARNGRPILSSAPPMPPNSPGCAPPRTALLSAEPLLFRRIARSSAPRTRRLRRLPSLPLRMARSRPGRSPPAPPPPARTTLAQGAGRTARELSDGRLAGRRCRCLPQLPPRRHGAHRSTITRSSSATAPTRSWRNDPPGGCNGLGRPGTRWSDAAVRIACAAATSLKSSTHRRGSTAAPACLATSCPSRPAAGR